MNRKLRNTRKLQIQYSGRRNNLNEIPVAVLAVEQEKEARIRKGVGTRMHIGAVNF